MRTLTAIIALFLTPDVAPAQTSQYAPSNPKYILASEPPPEYDHPYTGMLDIMVYDDEHELARDCKAPTRFGCVIYASPKQCFVKLLRDSLIKAYGLDPDLVWRHERAHCNSWPSSHIGGKTWPVKNLKYREPK